VPGALEDIRVIDFTHALNGPFCTMLLGHLGAEIIKIEPPAGDGFRRSWMPPGTKIDAYEFLWINVNKKSVVLNLKTERGVELARQLIARADVLVENYHMGQMEKFGLGYDALKTINPGLVYACSRGFGETGPYADYGSTAQTNNSMTGWTHTGWKYSGAPGTKALGIGDEAAGVSMVCGILAALHARERSGEGQRIVVSMQEALMGFMISEFHEHFVGVEVGNYPIPAADGYFTLRIPDLSDAAWVKLAKLMEREDLIADTRFADRTARKQNRAELQALIKAWARAGRARSSGTGCAPSIISALRCCRWLKSLRIRISKNGKYLSSAIIPRQGRPNCSRRGFTCRRPRRAFAPTLRLSANTPTKFLAPCSV
jgi:crotonobetainyl-CoA:carnitine CoA-transferase CaiB-like acyl-CoA transferase